MWLPGIPIIPTDDFSSGRAGKLCRFLLFHYSVGGADEARAARAMAANGPDRSASYHFMIGATGGVVQCVSLADRAWHAGKSGGTHSTPVGSTRPQAGVVNAETIGICLCNKGFGKGGDRYITMPHPLTGRSMKWHAYTDPQIQAAIDLANQLQSLIPTIEGMAGHSDVQMRKSDPGPLFPWPRVMAATGLPHWQHDWRSGQWSQNVASPAQGH